MRIDPKRTGAAVLLVLLFASQHAFGAVESAEPLVMNASGEGMLKVGQEQFQVNSVVIKLLDDGNAEITLVTEITVFLTATWSRKAGQQTIELVITGAATKGGIDGTGQLITKNDGKAISMLSLKAMSRTTKRNIALLFTAH
jgi:hypothetical protein